MVKTKIILEKSVEKKSAKAEPEIPIFGTKENTKMYFKIDPDIEALALISAFWLDILDKAFDLANEFINNESKSITDMG